jgi:hypothetical protein
MLEIWWRYLRIAWDKEPIGQHYLRRMLVSFKFELNMFVATVGSIPGVIVLGLQGRIRSLAVALVIAALAIAAVVLFSAAKASAGVLADVRRQLLLGVCEPPFDH